VTKALDAWPLLLVTTADATREALTLPELDGAAANRALAPVVGDDSVFTTSGERHRWHRALLGRPLARRRLADYAGRIEATVEQHCRLWGETAGRPVALQPRLHELTVDVLLAVLVGPSSAGRLPTLRAALLQDVAGPRAASALWPQLARDRTAIERELDEAFRATASGDGPTILGSLVAHDAALRPEDVRTAALSLAVAGHETAAVGLAWCLERALALPSATAALAEAVDHGGAALIGFVREALRQRPVIPLLSRVALRRAQIGSVVVEPGARVAPCAWLAHRDPSAYDEPAVFDPGRFTGSKATAGSWFVFGGGARSCLGAAYAELVVATALRVLLRLYDVRAAGRVPAAVARKSIMFVPRDGLRVVLTPRG
jgi:cytochrome P450